MTARTSRGTAIILTEHDPDAVDLKPPVATLTLAHGARAVIRQLGAYRLARNESPPAPV